MNGVNQNIAGWVFALALSGGFWRATAEEPSLKPGLLHTLGLEPSRQSSLEAAMARHDYAAAEELLAAEAGRNPKSQSLLLALANVLFLDGKQLNSAVVLKKAERLGPLDEKSQFLLALSYASLGRFNWAKPELERLAKINPGNAAYPYWLSRIAYRKTDILSAKQYAEKAIQLDPGYTKAYDQLGLCQEALNNWEDAVKAFREAIRLSHLSRTPTPWPAMNLGVLLTRMERLDDAEAQLLDSIATDPTFPVAHFRLGQVLEKKENAEGAIREFQTTARLDPTYPEPHYALARIYRKQGDVEAAARETTIFQELRAADKAKGIIRPD
ncbi:MAG: tetratricopeptide repeat protein [Bryobacteraceae bacterium]